MLSILIPVYRYDVGPLVRALITQLRTQPYEWEIRVYDDASPEGFREKLRELPGLDSQRVHLKELPENLGRARIRNLLASEAAYSTLLFLDADSDIGPGFIAAYRTWLNRPVVVSGGRTYDDRAIEPNQMLHWIYGRSRESRSAKQRAKRPYRGFQTNNFLVPQEVILHHPFDEDFRGYGHEDTVWGQELEKEGVEIVHLDNPVVHRGLEEHASFLRKQRSAVHNLRALERTVPALNTRLGSLARKLRWARPVLMPMLERLYPYFVNELTQDLPGSIYYLDAMKLYWYWQPEQQLITDGRQENDALTPGANEEISTP